VIWVTNEQKTHVLSVRGAKIANVARTVGFVETNDLQVHFTFLTTIQPCDVTVVLQQAKSKQ
jgi:hypothetical protein